jgi:hypothetical protein
VMSVSHDVSVRPMPARCNARVALDTRLRKDTFRYG